MSGDVKWECPECGRTTELPEGVTPGWHYRRTGGAHADNTCTAPMRRVKGQPMTIDINFYRHRIAEREEMYGGHHEAVRKTFGIVVSIADVEELLDIYEAVQEYANSVHTADANCMADDHDDCSARDALKKLEALIGGPKLSRPK